jgi:hypothetical protein
VNGQIGALLRASGAVALLLAIAAGCATVVPSVSAPPSASRLASPASLSSNPPSPSGHPPSPSPSTAVAPRVVCDHSAPTSAGTDDSGSPIPVTLTCENAVAAATAVVGADPGIISIEFDYRRWCPPGFFCALSGLNDGHVIFHMAGQGPDILVNVVADTAGTVRAASPQPLPSPSS